MTPELHVFMIDKQIVVWFAFLKFCWALRKFYDYMHENGKKLSLFQNITAHGRLIHLSLVMHMCIRKLVIIGSGNVLLPVQC